MNGSYKYKELLVYNHEFNCLYIKLCIKCIFNKQFVKCQMKNNVNLQNKFKLVSHGAHMIQTVQSQKESQGDNKDRISHDLRPPT